MSCHQLDGLSTSPNIAIFLNIYPEHLDYYSNFKSYFNAKANIAIHQKSKDYFIFNPK
jgi:UDP-N-acetylmuramoylalanine--D-glutamate ligase